ncbi:hypothetical protein NQ317_019174 [Molorchus minor]|uniref:Threonylcarbamoyl-AMP synthase n=1 Tax=Molorchus minor TaxID=1323400 RepID=A0ABQ9J5P5_9CUCU|nr:hypothetical protein NQ317_019174 [Molorchus minor]
MLMLMLKKTQRNCFIRLMLGTYETELMPLTNKNISIANNPLADKMAVEFLKRGSVIALPTDTVYGLACDATNSNAIDRLFTIKDRPQNKPLAICLHNINDIKKYASVKFLPTGLLRELLPGPVTLLLQRRNSDLSPLLTSSGKIGIRVPDYPFIRRVVEKLGKPLALSSANLSKEPESVKISQFQSIWSDIDGIFDGGYLGTNCEPSTIVDLSKHGFYFVVREGRAHKETGNSLRRHGLQAR